MVNRHLVKVLGKNREGTSRIAMLDHSSSLPERGPPATSLPDHSLPKKVAEGLCEVDARTKEPADDPEGGLGSSDAEGADVPTETSAGVAGFDVGFAPEPHHAAAAASSGNFQNPTTQLPPPLPEPHHAAAAQHTAAAADSGAPSVVSDEDVSDEKKSTLDLSDETLKVVENALQQIMSATPDALNGAERMTKIKRLINSIGARNLPNKKTLDHLGKKKEERRVKAWRKQQIQTHDQRRLESVALRQGRLKVGERGAETGEAEGRRAWRSGRGGGWRAWRSGRGG